MKLMINTNTGIRRLKKDTRGCHSSFSLHLAHDRADDDESWSLLRVAWSQRITSQIIFTSASQVQVPGGSCPEKSRMQAVLAKFYAMQGPTRPKARQSAGGLAANPL
jgi:hypothetical protein